MTGSGKRRKKTRKGKQEKRELPAAVYFAIHYEHPDGAVEPHKQAFKIPSKVLVECEDEFDVARTLKKFHSGFKHVLELDMRFCKGGEIIGEDFWDACRGSNLTSPVEIYCPAPLGPVPGFVHTLIFKSVAIGFLKVSDVTWTQMKKQQCV